MKTTFQGQNFMLVNKNFLLMGFPTFVAQLPTSSISPKEGCHFGMNLNDDLCSWVCQFLAADFSITLAFGLLSDPKKKKTLWVIG